VGVDSAHHEVFIGACAPTGNTNDREEAAQGRDLPSLEKSDIEIIRWRVLSALHVFLRPRLFGSSYGQCYYLEHFTLHGWNREPNWHRIGLNIENIWFDAKGRNTVSGHKLQVKWWKEIFRSCVRCQKVRSRIMRSPTSWPTPHLWTSMFSLSLGNPGGPVRVFGPHYNRFQVRFRLASVMPWKVVELWSHRKSTHLDAYNVLSKRLESR